MAKVVLGEQDTPIIQIVGRILGEGDEDNGRSGKYLIHTGWTRKTYQVSSRGLKVIRNLDIRIIDEPSDYVL